MSTQLKPRLLYDRSFFLLLGLTLSLMVILTAFRWSSPKQLEQIWLDKYEQVDVFQFVELSRNFEIEEELKQKQRPKPNPQVIVTSPDSEPEPKPTLEPKPVGDHYPIVVTTEIPIDTSWQEEMPFVIVEEMPVYPGGEKALFADINRNFRIPEIDRRAGLEGVVYLSYVVNAAGEVTNVKVIRGISPATDAEAVKAIQKLKRYSPGKQRGRAVSVIYTIPIRVILR